jgi:cell division transport system permease protein
MRGSSFGYLVKEGARSIYANRLMSLAAVGVLAACLMLIGGAFLFSLNVNSVVGYVEDQNEVVVFVQDDADEDTIQAMDSSLRAIGNVSQVLYISREQGLQDQMASWGEDAYCSRFGGR